MKERVYKILRIGVSAVLLLASAAWCVGWTVQAARPAGRVYDFAQEWTSARNWFTGQPVYLDYAQSIERHLGVQVATFIRYNAHPPASVLLVLPLGLLTYPQAYLAWTLLSLVCLGASLWLTVREPEAGFTITAAAAFLPLLVFGNAFLHQLIQGQLNLVLLALIAGAWVADRRGQSTASGILVGLAAAIKLFPGFLVLYFVATRNWRGVLAAAAGFALANLTAMGVLGTDAFVDYCRLVVPEVGGLRDAWTNASLAGFWAKLFDGHLGDVVPLWHAPWLARTLAIATGGLAAALAWRAVSKAKHRSEKDVAFAVCVVAMLLVSPITWDHYFVLLWLPIAIVWRACQGRRLAQAGILICTVFLVTVGPAWIWSLALPPGIRPDQSPAGATYVLGALSVQFYALLGFYLLSLRAQTYGIQFCRPAR